MPRRSTTGSVPDIWREERQDRVLRLGMASPDFVMAPGTVTNPATAGERGDDVTFLCRLEHTTAPLGVIFEVGGDGTNFRDAVTLTADASNLHAAWSNDLEFATLDAAFGEFVGDIGLHTYVLSVSMVQERMKCWVDARLFADVAFSDTGTLWAGIDDWGYLEVGGAIGLLQSSVADWSGTGLASDLEVYYHRLPAIF